MKEIKEKAQTLWCQHCKALQKTNNTVVECLYNPLDDGHDKAFCAANEDVVDALLALFNERAKEMLSTQEGTKQALDGMLRREREQKDTWWHDNIQKVKALIREGKNPQYEKDENLVHDHWHPKLALLWEIAIEALKEENNDS